MDDIHAKSKEKVTNVLHKKHLTSVIPAIEILVDYDEIPELVPIDVTKDIVEQVAGKLSGIAGIGRVDAVGLQQWLLRFSEASQRLRITDALLTSWMAKNTPP